MVASGRLLLLSCLVARARAHRCYTHATASEKGAFCNRFDREETVVDLVRRKDLQALAVSLLLICAAAPGLLYAQEEKPRQQRVWSVKESSTRLWIAGGMLVSASAQHAPESIPLSAIKALAYVTTSENPAADEIGAWVIDLWGAASDSGDAGEAAGFVIFPIVAGAAIPSLFLPVRRSRHLVYVDWEREGKEQKRVYLLGKSDALSLLNELRRATGLQCANAGENRCSNWVAREKKSAEEKESVGRYEHGRLVVVERGHGISYLGMEPIPQPPDPPAALGCPESSHLDARRWLDVTAPKDDEQQTLPLPESSKPKRNIPASQWRITTMLSEMTCRGASPGPAVEKK